MQQYKAKVHRETEENLHRFVFKQKYATIREVENDKQENIQHTETNLTVSYSRQPIQNI